MGKFKSTREPLRALPDLPAEKDVARFAAGAGTRATGTVEPSIRPTSTVASAGRQSWEELDKLDKDANPRSGINLRLNEYEHQLLKLLAEADERSIQQTIKRLLIPAAEAVAAALRGDRVENDAGVSSASNPR